MFISRKLENTTIFHLMGAQKTGFVRKCNQNEKETVKFILK